MDTFFAALKKTLIGVMFVIFGFVGTYVPQTWNQVETVHAGGAGGGYTIPQGVLALVEQAQTAISTTASAAFDAITSFATDSLYIKEFVLDGIAWAVAKTIIQSMVQSLINWINSGFQGSPSFVQDLEGFLVNAADSALGNYLDEIGGIYSFICSPFRLDIQIAIATQYQLTRTGSEYQPAETCTLSGIIDNIEAFTSGVQGSFGEDGWNDWLDITNAPEVYTPLGASLSAKAGGDIRILNAKNEEFSILNFGDGFLSAEICNNVAGGGQDCFISKPGKVISESLHKALGAGQDTLITADEIDEIIGAVLTQMGNMAITGAAGLLGLGGATGNITGDASTNFTYTPTATASNVAITLGLMQTARSTQINYNNLAIGVLPQLINFSNDPTKSAADRALAQAQAAAVQVIIQNTSQDIITLNAMIADFTDPAATAATQANIVAAFNALTLYTDANITTSQSTWSSILSN